MARSTNMLMIAGALLVLLGIAGLAFPVFTTSQNRDLAQIGGLQVQTQQDTSHSVPPPVSGGALVLGLLLVGGSLYRRRQS